MGTQTDQSSDGTSTSSNDELAELCNGSQIQSQTLRTLEAYENNPGFMGSDPFLEPGLAHRLRQSQRSIDDISMPDAGPISSEQSSHVVILVGVSSSTVINQVLLLLGMMTRSQ